MLLSAKCLLTAAIILSVSQRSHAGQDTSGVIEYEVTSRAEGNTVMFISGGPGGGNRSAPPPLPDVVTLSQQFVFTPAMGRLKTEAPKMHISHAEAGETAAPAGANGNTRRVMRRPIERSLYVDIANRKYIQVMQTTGDDPKTYYTEEDYRPAADAKLSGKTRKIAGYTCTRATVKIKDETFAVWYTTDIPISFSPVNGLLPDKGVVLSAESSKRSFVAKKVELKAVAANEVTLPQQAEKVTSAEMEEIRKKILEELHARPPSF